MLYQVHKKPASSRDYNIEYKPKLQEAFKDYISMVDIEYYNWPKTFKCHNLIFSEWEWMSTHSGSGRNGSEHCYRHKRNNQEITIKSENIVTCMKPKPFLVRTEELYQRKGVTDKYHHWLEEQICENGEWCYINNTIIHQKDFVKAKEYGVSRAFGQNEHSVNNLHKMYDALKDEDKFIYNCW